MNRMKRILSKQGVAGLQWPLCWNLFKLFKKPQTIWRHLKIFIVYSRNILLYKIKYILLKCSRNLKQWGHLESLSLFFFFLCFSLFFVAVKIFCWFSTKLNNMYIMEKVQIYIRQLDNTMFVDFLNYHFHIFLDLPLLLLGPHLPPVLGCLMIGRKNQNW